jgi:hypothetical protein
MPFNEPTAEFADRFPCWNRVEARSREDDFAFGLAAAIADPLWILGRQWQMLELKGEDAGTPIQVKLKHEVAEIDQIKLGSEPFTDIPEGESGQQGDKIPIEVLVEREAARWDWRMRVRVGQHFERLARLAVADARSLIDSVRSVCPISKPSDDEWKELDNASRRFVSLVAGRAINGETLMEKLSSSELDFVPASVRSAMNSWYNRLYSRPTGGISPAWNPERLDYEFRLRAQNPTPAATLHASSYRNGAIDWDIFRQEGITAASFQEQAELTLTPVHVTFAGQPMRRWWEFEDRAVNFGVLDVARTDLAKTILIEFATTFGDDWFVIPLDVKPNSLVRLKQLRVLDCFGVWTDIDPAREVSNDPLRKWTAYDIASSLRIGEGGDYLYVPPPTGLREESPPLEELRFARDEDANAVFAIEHTVPNELGEPTSGFGAHLELRRRLREQPTTSHSDNATTEAADSSGIEASDAPLPDEGLLARIKYVLATTVPANWIPFIATDKQNVVNGIPRRSVKLRRAEMLSTETEDVQYRIAPLSRLLDPHGAARVEWINEEAVGRGGVRVELRRQRTRSATGETYVWLGRKIGVGKGEARSGLRFDVVGDRN